MVGDKALLQHDGGIKLSLTIEVFHSYGETILILVPRRITLATIAITSGTTMYGHMMVIQFLYNTLTVCLHRSGSIYTLSSLTRLKTNIFSLVLIFLAPEFNLA
jgi:hypothetical protein